MDYGEFINHIFLKRSWPLADRTLRRLQRWGDGTLLPCISCLPRLRVLLVSFRLHVPMKTRGLKGLVLGHGGDKRNRSVFIAMNLFNGAKETAFIWAIMYRRDSKDRESRPKVQEIVIFNKLCRCGSKEFYKAEYTWARLLLIDDDHMLPFSS